MTGKATPGRVSPTEIGNLLAWARSLTQAGPAGDPADRAAYLAAKADLPARIADQHADDHPRHAEQAAAPPPTDEDTQ
jgi:hypothetical protein